MAEINGILEFVLYNSMNGYARIQAKNHKLLAGLMMMLVKDFGHPEVETGYEIVTTHYSQAWLYQYYYVRKDQLYRVFSFISDNTMSSAIRYGRLE